MSASGSIESSFFVRQLSSESETNRERGLIEDGTTAISSRIVFLLVLLVRILGFVELQ